MLQKKHLYLFEAVVNREFRLFRAVTYLL